MQNANAKCRIELYPEKWTRTKYLVSLISRRVFEHYNNVLSSLNIALIYVLPFRTVEVAKRRESVRKRLIIVFPRADRVRRRDRLSLRFIPQFYRIFYIDAYRIYTVS